MKRTLFLLLTFWAHWLPAQTGVIRGRVYNSLTNEALPFAAVRVQETTRGAYTDSLGNYEISGLEAGLYNLEASFLGYQSQVATEVQVFNSKPATVDFAMVETGDTLEEVTISASPFRSSAESPVSVRSIGVNEIERNPGGNRDISKVIQSLPGVAGTVGFRNDIIIRGGAPGENRFYLDGVEVPNINHFSTQGASGGPVGLINVNFIRSVDLYTGAFPADRGNTLSSVMEIRQKEGRTDRLGANLTLGSSDIGLTLEGPLSKKTTFLASGRRSYLQWLFTVLGLPFLPTYNDFQFKTHTRFDDRNELTVIGLGAIDDFELNLAADSTPQQKYILGYLPVNTQWNYTVGARYKHFLPNGYMTFVLSRNMLHNRNYKYENNDESIPSGLILDYLSREMENKFRYEYATSRAGFQIQLGANFERARYENSTYNRIATPTGLDTLNFESGMNFNKYGVFARASRGLLDDRLSLSLGLRLDGVDYNAGMANLFRQFSPRLALSYLLNERFSLNFNTGIYYQLPAYTVLGYRDTEGEAVNRDRLSYIRSKHLVGGLEYRTGSNGRVTAEGFYKAYDQYPYLLQQGVSLANLGGDFGVIGNAPADSRSEGRAYGFELMAQQRMIKGFFGILAYTFVRSEFTDSSGQYRPATWDNRHIVTFTAGKKFAKNWELGVKWRLYGGSPYTPWDLQQSSLISVWNVTGQGIRDYSLVNSKRLPASHQLDLRLDKKWYFSKWALNVYMDVQNVYNFQSTLSPYLDVVRDAQGSPVADPADPSRYLLESVTNASGTVLPSIGVVIEL